VRPSSLQPAATSEVTTSNSDGRIRRLGGTEAILRAATG
jgi:hypothetical protein